MLWHKITNEIITVIRQHTIHPLPNIHNVRVNDYWITIYCIKVWLTVLWLLCLSWLRSMFEVEPVLLVLPIACCTIRTFRKVRNIIIWISRMAEFDTMVCMFPANADQVVLTCTSNFNVLFWKTLSTGCRWSALLITSQVCVKPTPLANAELWQCQWIKGRGKKDQTGDAWWH